MRRMLDPKEIGGGGGDEKLYCHFIYFNRANNSKGGKVVLNYYSKKKDKFTYETFKNEFDEKKNVACSGYIHDGDNYFTVIYLELSSNGVSTDLYVRYNDTVKNMFNLTRLNGFDLQDNVSEVI